MIFDFNKYKGRYVMHCKTEEEAECFCKVMHDSGRTWCTGEEYVGKTLWGEYKTGMCYSFNTGQQCDINWFEDSCYTILEWGDFMEKEFTKADLKCGCEYCKDYNNPKSDVRQDEDFCTISHFEDRRGDKTGGFNYCPMCGRKLVGE